ncbi:MAG: hypothetical protein H0T90_08180 [Gemmatimonadales bacterium]|nr:hypothetical protein [Gemmatimonadales bacterium]
MRHEDERMPALVEIPTAATATEAEPAEAEAGRSGRVHLVVVTTRAAQPGNGAPEGTALVSRFWHPRDRNWSENTFDSLDHAMHLFVEESGWVLRQQQELEGPLAWELVFEARREDFARPSTEAILHDVGLTPEDVAKLMERVDRNGESGALGSRALLVILLLAGALIALLPRWLGRTEQAETMRTEIQQVIAECRAQYRPATTAADTARADAWLPSTLGSQRVGDPTCGAYRKRRMLR